MIPKSLVQKLIISIGIFLTFHHSGLSQNYLNSKVSWHLYDHQSNLGYEKVRDYIISLEGDTILGGQKYYKTKQQGVYTQINQSTKDTSVQNFTNTLNPIREDSGKFYAYNTSSKTEYLLHNFNLNVGDTAVGPPSCIKTVIKIDTIHLGSQCRKKFIFGPQSLSGNSFLFEGIGVDRGLFSEVCYGRVYIEGGPRLISFTDEQGNSLVVDSTFECTSSTNAQNQEFLDDHFLVLPNPYFEKLVVKNNSEAIPIQEIQMFDLQGRLIHHANFGPSEKEINVYANSIPSGMYILYIHTSIKVVKKKVIKL